MLDDSLSRLKEIKRNNSGISNPSKNRSFAQRTQNKTLTSRLFVHSNEWIGSNRPDSDKSCTSHYPINCVSDNWEIIRCYIFLDPLVKHKRQEGKYNQDDSNGELDNCRDFKVNLEHIRYKSYVISFIRVISLIKNLLMYTYIIIIQSSVSDWIQYPMVRMSWNFPRK